jgi:hypothetical protein
MELVTIYGFLVSSRQHEGSDVSTRIYDTFLPDDITNTVRCSILSTDVLNWKYGTLTVAEEKQGRSAVPKVRRVGYSIFQMDKEIASFVGAMQKENQ